MSNQNILCILNDVITRRKNNISCRLDWKIYPDVLSDAMQIADTNFESIERPNTITVNQ